MKAHRSASQVSPSVARRDAHLLGLPFTRLLFVAFGAAAILLGILSIQLYNAAWADAWREVREKHQVLAMNLAAPVQAYVDSRRSRLAGLADELRAAGVPGRAIPYGQLVVLRGFTGTPGVTAVYLVGADGDVLFHSADGDLPVNARHALADSEAFHHTLARRSDYVSGVASSPIDGVPRVMIGQPVRGRDGAVAAVLLAELSTAPIEALRRQVQFGRGGHAAVVDQAGRIIAHPSKDWIREMRDLSGLSVVQTMLAGGTGVTRFYSPFVKADMVAGYAAIPELGWGVMVPQPEREIAERVERLVWRQAGLALLSLVAIAVLAYALAAGMTRPGKPRQVSDRRPRL